MLNTTLYGFPALTAEYDLRLASRPGFVQRYQQPIRQGGCVKSLWFFDTKEAAERARDWALFAENIKDVEELGTFEIAHPQD